MSDTQNTDERDREREKNFITYTHKLFDKSSRTPRHHLLKVNHKIESVDETNW